MKKQLLFLLLLFCSTHIFGQYVSETLAVKMANSYFQSLSYDTNEPNIHKVRAKIASSEIRQPESISPLGKADMWFVPVDDGWVLLSSNIKATPILAHIQLYEKPVYDSLPDAAKDLFNTFEDYLLYVNEHDSEYTVDNRWQSIMIEESSSSQNLRAVTADIGPLLTVHWNQAYGGSCSTNKVYNKFCPTVNNSNICNKAYVGCVAVAIAQIMWYWNWPYAAQVPTTVGGSTTELKFYDWDKMPTSINDYTDMENVDMIAGFLRDCGYKLDMNYGANGSSASDNNAVNTLKAFGYDENTINLRSKWNTSGWTNMLRTNIDNGQPVYYGGWSKSVGGDGHAFVVDGYRTGNSPIYHINFGWGGYADGWYNIDDAYVNDSTHFEHRQKAIFGIRPAPACIDFTLNNSLFFPSKFCYAIGGELTLSNVTLTNVVQGELYSSTQVKLLAGVTIAEGSNVHIAIKDIPCNTISSSEYITEEMPTEQHRHLILSHKNIMITSSNPAKEAITISSQEQIESVRIYAITGQCVLQTNKTDIDVSALSQGIYIITATTTIGNILQSKFIKQ